MIKYNLECECGKRFESWFSNSSEFDSLCKKKLIKCIYCDSSSVNKTMMAPNLPSKSNKVRKKTAPYHRQNPDTRATAYHRHRQPNPTHQTTHLR